MATTDISFAVAGTQRWHRFAAVRLLGFLLQLAVLWSLTACAHWHWLAATLLAVELAVVHNFLWHARWTWRDRSAGGLIDFARFQLSNGVASMAGNAALMMLFTGGLGWRPIPANACAVAVTTAANYVAADRWVFRRSRRLRLTLLLGVACGWPASGAFAQTSETVAAWQRCVAATEARLEQSRAAPRTVSAAAMLPDGESMRVPSGTISDWRRSVFVRGITLDRLLQRLQHPGTPPPQEDVVSSRVIARTGDSLRVAIRLVRRAIVTVTYDTEHEMQFRRWSPSLATARSVATRIEEVGGTDHGFLWRLHSYWRYEEVEGGVLVQLESLTLSRDVPSIVRPIAAPLITRIARESMIRTLDAVRGYLSAEDTRDTD
jgi:putative flippase GtrA